jgi:hypothetical protein
MRFRPEDVERLANLGGEQIAGGMVVASLCFARPGSRS